MTNDPKEVEILDIEEISEEINGLIMARLFGQGARW